MLLKLFLLFGILWFSLETNADDLAQKKPSLTGVMVMDMRFLSYEPYIAFTGFLDDLMQKVSEKTGFTSQLVVSDYPGMVNENGTYNGTIGSVNLTKVDFALGLDLAITEDKKRVVDFTVPFQVESLVMVINEVHAKNMTTFENLVNYNNHLSGNSTQIAVGMLIDGIEHSILKQTSDLIGKNLLNFANREPAVNFVSNITEGLSRSMESKFGFIMTEGAALLRLKPNCNLTLLRDNRNLAKFEYGIALAKGSKWLEPFNRAIRELAHDGTIEKISKNNLQEIMCPGKGFESILSNSSLPEIKDELEEKRKFVKQMMLNSWNAYVEHAWGHEAVMPISKSIYSPNLIHYPSGDNCGLSIVASMSTLWIMGFKEKFAKAKEWISTHKFDLCLKNQNFVVHDVIVNYVGGLLSCYALTKGGLFLEKAEEFAQMIEPAFNTSTGIPYQEINLKTGIPSDPSPDLSQSSGFQLDYNYLSDVLGQTIFRHHGSKMQKVLKQLEKPIENLYFDSINVETKKWNSEYSSLFSRSRELYSSLVKTFIQSNLQDVRSIRMYKDALDAIEEARLFDIFNGTYYVRGYDHYRKRYSSSMEYSGCYLGAMLSLGASAMKRALEQEKTIDFNRKHDELYRIQMHSQLAEKITETCQKASDGTKTGLGPRKIVFTNETQEVQDRMYWLSPELAESNFILWRLTHSPKYRENAWKMAQAIHQHCRAEKVISGVLHGSGGYTAIDTRDGLTREADYQPPIFLSATLKYLYLTFTEDSVLPLDKWVFNSVGHPLPIG